MKDEDWRNREKLDDYILAANKAIYKTDNLFAPWVLVPGNNKHYARINVLQETINWVKQELNRLGLRFINHDNHNDNQNKQFIESIAQWKKYKKKDYDKLGNNDKNRKG